MGDILNFEDRHIGISAEARTAMLKKVGAASLDDLVRQVIPDNIQFQESIFDLEALSEHEYLEFITEKSQNTKVYRSLIGQGYYATHTPSVTPRNTFENHGWCPQTPPSQAELAHGRPAAPLIC